MITNENSSTDSLVLESLGMYNTFEQEQNKYRDDVMSKITSGNIPLTSIGDIPLKFLDVTKLPGVPEQNILTESKVYKPFRYEFGYAMWELQNKIQWMHHTIPLTKDVRDWKTKISFEEKNLLSNIFPLFVLSDMVVEDAWIHQYAPIFRPHEIQMGIAAIANMEATHKAGYSYLLDELAFPVSHYSKFMEFKAMNDKYEYTKGFRMDTLTGIALAIFMFGCMTEGVQLFGTFAIMMNFPRNGKMVGMGQVVSWSVRDEQVHCSFAAQLFKFLLLEFGHLIDLDRLFTRAKAIAEQVVKNEYGFAELAFEAGDIPGMSLTEHKQYIRHITDMRLKTYGFAPQFGEEDTPYEWLNTLLGGVELVNFFEQRSTAYTQNSLTGTFEKGWEAAKTLVVNH